MKTIKYLINGGTAYEALKLSVLAAIAIFVANTFEVPGWILFIGWVGHDVFCTQAKDIASIFIQAVIGVFLAITILILGSYLGKFIQFIGGPLAVFSVVYCMYFIKKAKYLNNIIAYFLGMIAWFSYNHEPELKSIVTIIVTIGTGFLFAHINARVKVFKV